MKEVEISAVVSGSFKFKDQIDKTIDELTELDVNVLAPDKGWLYIPPAKQIDKRASLFRPEFSAALDIDPIWKDIIALRVKVESPQTATENVKRQKFLQSTIG